MQPILCWNNTSDPTSSGFCLGPKCHVVGHDLTSLWILHDWWFTRSEFHRSASQWSCFKRESARNIIAGGGEMRSPLGQTEVSADEQRGFVWDSGQAFGVRRGEDGINSVRGPANTLWFTAACGSSGRDSHCRPDPLRCFFASDWVVRMSCATRLIVRVCFVVKLMYL